MGFIDSLKNIGSKLAGPVLDFAGDFLGDQFIGDPNSADAFKRQKQFYKHRYQWMMEDMRKAGLNPILAAASAGFSTSGTPAVSMSTLPNQNAASAYEAYSRGGLAEEQEKTEKVEQLKTMAETKTEIERKYKERAQAGLTTEEERAIWFQIEKWQSELFKNYRAGTLSTSQKSLVETEVQKLTYAMKELKRVSEVYQEEASKYLVILGEIAKKLGINIGIITGLKRGK